MKKWVIRSSLEQWNFVADEISEILMQNEFDKNFILSFSLALDEAFANISMYSYNDNEGTVEITLSVDLDKVKAELRDYGKQFNPLTYQIDTGIDKPVCERKIGGLGIFIIKKQTDNQTYVFENNTNILTLEKRRRKNGNH